MIHPISCCTAVTTLPWACRLSRTADSITEPYYCVLGFGYRFPVLRWFLSNPDIYLNLLILMNFLIVFITDKVNNNIYIYNAQVTFSYDFSIRNAHVELKTWKLYVFVQLKSVDKAWRNLIIFYTLLTCDNYKAAFMGLISDVKGSRKKVTHAEKQVLFKSDIKFATCCRSNQMPEIDQACCSHLFDMFTFFFFIGLILRL